MSVQHFRSFAIFGAMRSGSNLLERNINQFDGLQCHGELFNPAFIGWSDTNSYMGINRSERDAAPDSLIDAISENDPHKLPGFRIFRDHNQNAINQFLDDRKCAKIILTRNPIDSFVSLKIARKTDQWLIHDQKHRKTAQIYFDMREFDEYQKVRAEYSEMVLQRLLRSKQDYFEINYDQVTDLNQINILASFLGANQNLEKLEQPIKRQNPGPLWQKIINYDEIRQKFDLPPAEIDLGQAESTPAETGTDLSRAYFCDDKSLIFAPIPSAPDGCVRKWVANSLGAGMTNGFSADALYTWQQTHKAPFSFAILRHPVARAYDVFMRKIFMQNGSGFAAIREALEAKFGVFLPNLKDPLEAQNYDATAHNAAFKQFLAFIHHNLTEKTGIRTDGRWRPQYDLIDGYTASLGKIQVFKEPELALLATYLTNRFDALRDGIGIMPDAPDWPISLAQIYDAEIEDLAKTAFAVDYKRFEFECWA